MNKSDAIHVIGCTIASAVTLCGLAVAAALWVPFDGSAGSIAIVSGSIVLILVLLNIFLARNRRHIERYVTTRDRAALRYMILGARNE